ncbi:arsenate reductase ArsC [Yinghuangia aomiensis]|uniref:Arsenate reductase ArsC n=2 Tax=Yinghuangia aomiensis TaxID=676205 RepID=A0ABP9HU14_9ACTN
MRRLGGGRVNVWSSGPDPGDRINPDAVVAMDEVGIDISDQIPALLTEDVVQASDVVVTIGCADACPIFPGKLYQDWQVDDPRGQGIEAMRSIRDQIEQRVRALLAEVLTDGS